VCIHKWFEWHDLFDFLLHIDNKRCKIMPIIIAMYFGLYIRI